MLYYPDTNYQYTTAQHDQNIINIIGESTNNIYEEGAICVLL